VISLTPRPALPPAKEPCCLLDVILGGSQSQSGRGGEEKKSLPMPDIEIWSFRRSLP